MNECLTNLNIKLGWFMQEIRIQLGAFDRYHVVTLSLYASYIFFQNRSPCQRNLRAERDRNI